MAKKKGSSLEAKKRQLAAGRERLRDLKSTKKVDAALKKVNNQIGTITGNRSGTRKKKR